MKPMEFDTRAQYDDDGSFDTISEYGSSYLEKNCNQIFVKGPALTKEILEKMNADLVPKETYMFGYQLRTKRVFFTAGLCVLLLSSFLGFSLMWFTDIFDNFLLSNIIISNNSNTYDMWVSPSPKLNYEVYLFNYTNVEAYRYGIDQKLHVHEIGPYVYQETMAKVNVKFNDDGTVSYQEMRSYVFQPKLSKGKQSDQVFVPNIPLLSGSAMLRHHNYFARLAFSGIVTGLEQEAFIKLSADKFIMGYDDELYELSSNLNKLLNVKTPEKFGLFAFKKGLQPKVYTVNTGRDDVNKVGILETINGASELDLYSTSECNSFQVTDGSFYPAKKIQRKQDVAYFYPLLCRTLPLVFENEVNILGGKIPAFRYTQPEDVFDSADEKPENQCYCSDSGQCAMKGVFNLTSCMFGSPAFISHPHFHRADPKLQNGVNGLNPNGREYKVEANIHPIFGFLMSGRGNMQVNIQVLKAYGVSQVDYLEDELMLPIAWFNVILNDADLPQDFIDIIYQVTFTLKGVRLALEYGSLLTTLMTLVFLVLVLRRWWPCCEHVDRMSRRSTPVPNGNGVI